jgi:hypothetical protein
MRPQVRPLEWDVETLVRELCTLPHRGTTTAEERKAADWVEARLRALGLETQREAFRAPTSFGWSYIAIFGGFLAMAGLSVVAPGLAFAGAAALCGFYVLEQASWAKIPAVLLPHGWSQNVMATIRPRSVRKRILVLAAHLDTSRSGPMFDPKMVVTFRATYLLALACQYTVAGSCLARWMGVEGPWLSGVQLAACGYMAFAIALLCWREAFGAYVNGANDNGSGVASLLSIAAELSARAPAHTEVRFVFTGAEEVGMAGMRHFVATHGRELPRHLTEFIVIDNAGAGRLKYCTGEGTILPFPYSEKLIRHSNELAAEPRFAGVRPYFYARAYFDTLVPASRGWGCMTLVAVDERALIPNWHWPTDVPENVDWALVRQVREFARALIERVDNSALLLGNPDA